MHVARHEMIVSTVDLCIRKLLIVYSFQAIQLIKQDRKLNVPRDYADNFRKTDAVFKYQSVFDPITKKIVRLNEVAETDNVTEEELQFAGPYPFMILLSSDLIVNVRTSSSLKTKSIPFMGTFLESHF